MTKEIKIFLLAVVIPAVILIGLTLKFMEPERRPGPPPMARAQMVGADHRGGPHEPRTPNHEQLKSFHEQRVRYHVVIGSMIGLALLAVISGAYILARRAAFLAQASHRLRTPMTAISLCAELVQDPNLPEEQRQKALATILKNTKELEELVCQASL